MLVKICGLTTPEDAAFAASEGADLLGFVVHPPSPRHCANLVAATAEVKDLGVLVTVGDDAEVMMRLAASAGMNRIQPHVSKPFRFKVVQRLKKEGYFILLPWRDEAGQEPHSADLYLWEASPQATGVEGGSGQPHAMAFPPPGPFLLAGGLDSENLGERLGLMATEARLNLQGFDAASRLEKAPGIKDHSKVRAFIQTAKPLSQNNFIIRRVVRHKEP